MEASLERVYYIYYPRLLAAIAYFIAGLITQSFIIIVNVIERLKGRPVTDVDQILISLGIVRTCFHCLSLLDMFLVVFLKNRLNPHLQLFFYLLLHYSNLSDIWLTTLFSVVFCLKIANFHNALFLSLKKVLSRRVVHLMVASVLASIFFISLFSWIDHEITSSISVQNITINNTEIPSIIHIYIFITIGNSVPFFIYCTSTVLLITSLCLHMKRMRGNSSVTTNLDTYYKAIQFMTFCLFCFILRIGINLVVLRYYYDIEIMWLFVIWNTFPTLDSIYLIHRTNKLKDQVSRILRPIINCLLNKKRSETSSRDLKGNDCSMKSK